MIWFILQEIGFYIFLLLTVYYVYKKEYETLMVLFFWGMVFAACYKFVYTIWFPTKLISLGMLVCLFRDSNKRYSNVTAVAWQMFSAFLLMFILSDVWGLLLPKEYAMHINALSRVVNQGYTYISAFIILFYGTLLEPGLVKRLYPKYCFAIEIAIVIGLIHFFCNKFGIPFMPILRQNGTVNDVSSVVAQFGNSIVGRIYGFSGEPKNFGFLVLPYVLISLLSYNNGFIRKSKAYHISFGFLGMFVLFNTFSSSALINFALVAPLILTFFSTRRTMFGTVLLGIILFMASSLVMLKFTDYKTSEDPNFIESFYERTFGRAEEELENGRQETRIFETYMQADAVTKSVGWGVSQYTFHVPGMTVGTALIPLQSGLVLTLADFGLVGILYLCALFYLIWSLIFKAKQEENHYALSFAIATLSSFVGSMTFGMMTGCFIYLMLALYAYYDEMDYEEIEEETI